MKLGVSCVMEKSPWPNVSWHDKIPTRRDTKTWHILTELLKGTHDLAYFDTRQPLGIHLWWLSISCEVLKRQGKQLSTTKPRRTTEGWGVFYTKGSVLGTESSGHQADHNRNHLRTWGRNCLLKPATSSRPYPRHTWCQFLLSPRRLYGI